MALYLVVEEEQGYYEDPDQYIIKGIFTSPEAVATMKISESDQKYVSVLSFEEKDLNKVMHISLNSYFGTSGEEVVISNYKDFLKEHNLEKKPKNKI